MIKEKNINISENLVATKIFHTVDPLAELFNYQSPFAYAANNPVRFIDYMGLGYYDPELGYVSDDVDVTYYQPFDWT
ncbi:MAG: hypothetical protein JW798_02075, partial [Prolixibacteraceae bacterium]|nr:hypothetical protein [Prolixibacteraceae bacterium]